MKHALARIALCLGIAVVQYLLVRLGLVMGIAHGNVSPVWPATGFAIAVLLRFGTKLWPFVGVGSFFGLLQTGVGIPVTTGETAAAVLEALAAIWMVRRWIEADAPFSDTGDALRFCVMVGGIATAIGATIGVMSLCLGGVAPWESFDYLWGTWWLGDAMGALIVAPFLIVWTASGAWRLDRAVGTKIGVVFVLLILAGIVAFWGPFVSSTGVTDYPIAFVTLPMVVSAAFIAGGRGATASCLICSAMAISGTAQGLGPFFRGSVNESLLLLQSYLIVVSATATILTAVLKERDFALGELWSSRNELDERVSERTRELVHANELLKQEVAERRQAEEALRGEKKFTETALNCQLDTFFLFEPSTGRAIRWNRAFRDISGYTDEEIARMPAPDSYYSPDDLKRASAFIQDTLETGIGRIELDLICKDGRTVPTEYNVAVVEDADGSPRYLISIGRDVTERKQAENALRRSEERFRDLIDQAADAIFVHDHEGRFLEVNQQASASLGYTREELLSMTVSDVDPEAVMRGDAGIFWPSNSATFESVHRRKDGSTFPVEVRLGPIEHSEQRVVLSTVRDVRGRKETEAQIKANLKEKEVLLREIHHRVKNNLSQVCSLLSLQAGYADETHRRLFEDLEMRVMAMAMAHEKLYKSETLSDLDLEEYVTELIDHLVGTKTVGASVRLKKDIHRVSFGLDTAIPVGFVLTELVSNCLKHAFPDGRGGEIRVSLRSVAEREFELAVKDNGVGMPEDIDLENSGSLGMDLVHAFALKLKGRIEILRDNGTEIRLRFREV